MVVAMIHCDGIDRSYWALAMHATLYIRNRVWSGGADGVPYQMVTDLPPDLDRLRVFGCPYFVKIDKQLRRKLDDRAWSVRGLRARLAIVFGLESPDSALGALSQ